MRSAENYAAVHQGIDCMSKVKKNPVDVAASVRARLYNIAQKGNYDYNYLLRQYFQERFLFRLSKSQYSGHFILKGGLLFIAYDVLRDRPTKDIDLLGIQIGNDLGDIKKIMQEISRISYDDGVTYLADGLRVEIIAEDMKYAGIRIHIPCRLGYAKNSLQIDVGFGDIAVPVKGKMSFPVLLDYEAPLLKIYTIEYAIAEKFEAIVSLGLASSRMKDYYDIVTFASHSTIILSNLTKAIKSTFKNRQTELSGYKRIFAMDFISDHGLQIMWQAYLKRNKFSGEVDFSTTVLKIETFLSLCFKDSVEDMVWNPENFMWEAARE